MAYQLPFSPHWHWQLSNAMTFQLSASGGSRYASGPSAGPHGLSRSALQRAKAALVGVEVVGVTEDMAGFERLLSARWPLVFGRAGCPIPSGPSAVNPSSKHAVKGEAPILLDNRTRAAIRRLNELDTSLYELARRVTLAQQRCLVGAAYGGVQAAAPGSSALVECLRDARARSRTLNGVAAGGAPPSPAALQLL